MEIRWRIRIQGMVHNIPDGVKPGDVIDVDAETARR